MNFASNHAYISKRKALLNNVPKDLAAIKEERQRDDSCSSLSDEELDKFNSDSNSDEEIKEVPVKKRMAANTAKPIKPPKAQFNKPIPAKKPNPAKPILHKRESVHNQSKMLAPIVKAMPMVKAVEKEKVSKSIPISAVAGYKGKRYRQEVDTNIVGFNLSVLKDKTAMATGDAVFCSKCRAILNVYSILKKDKGKQLWICEFCNNLNTVQLDEEELPKVDHLTYILESAQQVMEKKAGKEDTTLMFCIDVSGSMCVTQAVLGKVALKYDKLKDLQALKKFGAGSQQMYGESSNQTYISRMQCVQTAIESQLKELAIGAPKQKVGIVTFSNEVTLIGDGSLVPKTFAGDKLMNFEGLLETSIKDADTYMTKSIEETQEDLIKRLGKIEESGQTALGPGLTVALGAAIKGTPGSRVIICTDGLANVGFGSVENLEDESVANSTKDFYTKIGELAKTKGVSISIVSIVSEECNLEMLSPLADLTGGDIIKVDPMNLSNDFANILSESIIATNVELRMILHKGLTFRNESNSQLSEDGSLLIKPIGNVTEGQEVTIEYCVKPEEELKKLTDVDFTKVTELPFQAQISYFSLDGNKCVRLITKKQSITFEKEKAKKEANFQVISVHAIQKTAILAQKGDYRGAQANSAHWKKMIKGSAEYNNYVSNIKPLYQALDKQQLEDLLNNEVDTSERALGRGKIMGGSGIAIPVPKSLKVGKMRSNDTTISSLNRAAKISSKKMSSKK